MKARAVIIISADSEWRAVGEVLPGKAARTSPFGEWFELEGGEFSLPPGLIFLHGGWGKIAAAASTQYAIDAWQPDVLINLGTCGGFQGEIERGTIVLVDRTIVYDIVEQMGDYEEHIAHYSTQLDLSWLKSEPPLVFRRALIVSGDRDLAPEDIPLLKQRYGAVVGDWESGAIAWVASRNQVRCLILRGVTDLVSSSAGEAYGNIELFHQATRGIIENLVSGLHHWLAQIP